MSKVSVIIPCHNVEKYLPTCLNSVLNQTLDDIEVLAIDDHSTDNTLKILYSFQKEYSTKLRVFLLQESRGVSAARNLGLKYAQGEFIGFVDADDVISLNMYKDFYDVAKARQVSVVIGNCERIEDWQYLHQETFFTTEVQREGYIEYIRRARDFFGESPACWDKLFLHSLIENSRFLEGRIFEDVGFTYPILLKAKEAYELIRYDYLYRYTPGSITKGLHVPTIKILDMLEICLDMKNLEKAYNFDSKQRILLEDCIHERLLRSLYLLSDWKLLIDEKNKIFQKMITLYEYYFPDFRKFSTIYGNILFADLAIRFQDFVPEKFLTFNEIEKYKEDVLKLVKSLENSSYS